MWKIIKSDLAYHKNSIISFLAMIFFVFIYNAFISPGNAEFMIFLMTFMMINSYVTMHAREKRNRLQLRLPLSARELGGVRILIVYILSLLVIGLLFISYLVLQRDVPFPYQRIITMVALSLFLFTLYFIFSDIFTTLFSKYGRFVMMLGILVLALFMAMGILVIKQTNATGSAPGFMVSIIEFIKNINPFTDRFGWFRFLMVVFVLSFITIFTFNRRKSYF